jgi:hypothetical protein
LPIKRNDGGTDYVKLFISLYLNHLDWRECNVLKMCMMGNMIETGRIMGKMSKLSKKSKMSRINNDGYAK